MIKDIKIMKKLPLVKMPKLLINNLQNNGHSLNEIPKLKDNEIGK